MCCHAPELDVSPCCILVSLDLLFQYKRVVLARASHSSSLELGPDDGQYIIGQKSLGCRGKLIPKKLLQQRRRELPISLLQLVHLRRNIEDRSLDICAIRSASECGRNAVVTAQLFLWTQKLLLRSSEL